MFPAIFTPGLDRVFVSGELGGVVSGKNYKNFGLA